MNTMEHRVRERAYYIWEGEGRVFGRADAHWIQAEAELAGAGIAAEASLVETPVEAPAARKAAKPAKVATTKAAPKAAAPKAAPKAAVSKAPAKTKRAPRAAETGIALH